MNASQRRHATGAQASTARRIADRMYHEAKGDLARATDMVANYVSKFPILADELVRLGARSLLNEIGQLERKRIETAVSVQTKKPHTMNPGVHAAVRRAVKLGQIVEETFFDMPFKWNGVDTKLGDLTGDQVVEIGNGFLGQGTDMVRKGKWLIAAGSRAGERKMRAALTAQELAKIKAEAERMTV